MREVQPVQPLQPLQPLPATLADALAGRVCVCPVVYDEGSPLRDPVCRFPHPLQPAQPAQQAQQAQP